MKCLLVLWSVLAASAAEDFKRQYADIASVEGNLGLDKDLYEETKVSFYFIHHDYNISLLQS